MSKKTKFDKTSYDDTSEKTASQRSHFLLKTVSVLLLAGMLVGIFVPVCFSFAGGNFKITDGSVLGGNESIFFYLADIWETFLKSESNKAFDFLQTVYQNKYLHGVVVATALLVISTAVTLFAKKTAPVWFRIDCVICVTVLAVYGGYVYGEELKSFDIVMLTGAVALLATVVSIVYSIARKRAQPAIPVLCFLFLVGATALTCFFSFPNAEDSLLLAAVNYFSEAVKEIARELTISIHYFSLPSVKFYEALAYITILILAINVVLTVIQMGTIRTNRFTVVRYFLQLCVTVVAMVTAEIALGSDVQLPFILSAACILIAFALSLFAVLTTQKETEEEEETLEDDLEYEMDTVLQETDENANVQPYDQPYPQVFHNPVPNVYINITPSGVTSITPTAQTKISTEKQNSSTIVRVPVAETKTKKTKKRSFLLILAVLASLAAMGLFLYQNVSVVEGFVKNFDITSTAFLLTAGFALASLVAIILSFIAYGKANKGVAIGAVLLYAVGAAACLVYVQLHQDGIVAKFTGMEWLCIAAMVCAVLAVIFALIGMILTGKTEEKEEAKIQEIILTSNVQTAPETKTPFPVVDADEEDDEEETDPFLLSLARKERREFKKVFLEGNAPDYLPEYKRNGNNKRFFDAIFVYLNKTRNLMSAPLLKNIYDYMQANK